MRNPIGARIQFGTASFQQTTGEPYLYDFHAFPADRRPLFVALQRDPRWGSWHPVSIARQTGAWRRCGRGISGAYTDGFVRSRQRSRVFVPAVHSRSVRRARRRLAPRPARTPPRRPAAARVRLLDGAALARRGCLGRCPRRTSERLPPSFLRAVRAPCSRFPAKPLLRLHPRSRRRAGVQRGAPLRCNPMSEGNGK